MKSYIDEIKGVKPKSVLNKLILITSLEIILIMIFKEYLHTFIYFLLIINLYKFYVILFRDNRLTSPIFFTSVAFIFWMSIGNFLNVILTKYSNKTHYCDITLLVSVSYLILLIGLATGKKIRLPKIKRSHFYLDYKSGALLLYGIILFSMVTSVIYNFPIIKALFQGNYFGNRITMIYGRGYLNMLGSFHTYALPFLFMVKFHKSIKINWFDVFLLLVSFFLIIIPLQRGPVLTLFLMYLFIYNDFKKPISIKKLIKYGFITVLLFGSIVPAIRGINRGYLEILRNEIGIHTWNLSHYIEMTQETGYFGLKPLTMALAILLPGHQVGFEIWIKEYSPINVNVGGASMSLIGEGFMEYGLVGVMINFFILGLLLTLLFNHRNNSYGYYFLFLYFLNRTESIIQFGFGKVLITFMIVFVFVNLINNFKPNVVSKEDTN
ncbi:O-antigen polymerase [Yeosuana marina]|uniref:O-antigen polymerase n=1 Tax=Yeosuana marina TaxID=1565536 RepID=UPI0014203E27|nr:O-antigen polymerase [Yeosuana marina]